ncbi:MAG: sodium:calcium antiporter [Anaerolineae bacterium]
MTGSLWLRFGASAVAVVVAGVLAARAGDAIALRTGLGRALFGTLLLAAATSLPELTAAISAVSSGLPELAAGNMLGSILLDMLFLGVLDLINRPGQLLHRVAITHSVTAAVATLMLAAAALFILVPLAGRASEAHLDSVILIGAFVAGMRLVQVQARGALPGTEVEPEARCWPLWLGLLGFAGAAALLILAMPVLVSSAAQVAAATGLGVGLVGLLLFPLITGLPDLASSVAAVRDGAYDLAVGSLLGTCAFNVFALAVAGLFFAGGSLFGALPAGFAVVALLGLLLIDIALLGNLGRLEWRVLGVEWDALLIITVYAMGLYVLYRTGLASVAR